MINRVFDMTYLSVVVPVFRAETTIQELTERVVAAASQITEDFEIIYVDDHGGDNSWALIEELAAAETRVRGIKLCRNFGQHYALTAGLDLCRGEWTVIMDCDLQDQPEFIGALHARALEGYDVVLARRIDRDDGFLDHVTSSVFYRVFNALTGSTADSKVGAFRIMSRKGGRDLPKDARAPSILRRHDRVDGFRHVDDRCRSQRPYGAQQRLHAAEALPAGFRRRSLLSNRPLVFATRAGLAICVLSLLTSVAIVIQRVRGAIPEIGFASVIVSIFFLSGAILTSLGLLGAYIGRIYDEVKGRPSYIIDRMTS